MQQGRQIQPGDLKKKAIGIVVCALRKKAGLSQEALSARCGFERTYLSRVERGILNPTAIRLWLIADEIQIPFQKLVAEMEFCVADQKRSRSR